MKWLELSIVLTDNSKINAVLSTFVKPYINDLYKNEVIFNWHFFREPYLLWRIYANDEAIVNIKKEIDESLNKLEKSYSSTYKEHYFNDKYIDEKELYGEAWELCYKQWEANSNLALYLCTESSKQSIPFHLTRTLHLFSNECGCEFQDEVAISLKWAIRLLPLVKPTTIDGI